MSTTQTRPRPKGSRMKPHADGDPRRYRGPGRTSPVRDDEILPPPDDSTADLHSYARTFQLVLEDALDGLPADGGGVMLAYSRATLKTFDVTALSPHKSEAVRLRVLREVCAERGLERLRGGGRVPAEDWHVDEEADSFQVPRGRPSRDGEHPRRSGKR